jgi:ADP-heptose:LPS heptosyltransferase
VKPEPESILVYSMGEILGDGVWKLPLIAGLRAAAPDASLSWAAAHAQGTVYAGALKRLASGLIDDIITGPGAGADLADFLTAWRPFGGRRFETVIDTQARMVPALVARRAARGRFVSQAGRFALSSARPHGAWPAAGRDQIAALFSLGVGAPVSPAPLPLVTDQAAAAADALLPKTGALIGLSPGAGGMDRRWPLERFLALANTIQAQGATAVFFLGPVESAWESAIRAACPQALLPEQAGATVRGPDLVFALARRLSAAVANDSGTGHMLGLAGAPLVTLYKTRRLAAKFPTWSPRPVAVVAEDFGASDIAVIPTAAVQSALHRLMKD